MLYPVTLKNRLKGDKRILCQWIFFFLYFLKLSLFWRVEWWLPGAEVGRGDGPGEMCKGAKLQLGDKYVPVT